MSRRVLITPIILRALAAPRYAELLESHGFEPVFPARRDRALTESDLLVEVPGCVAVLAGMEPFNRRVLTAAASALRTVARVGVGYDAVDLAAATELGMVVTIAVGQNHDSVAEQAFGLMIGVLRRIVAHDRGLRHGQWLRERTRPVRGLTLGLVGLGRIGQAMVTRARAFGMRVVAHDVSPPPGWGPDQGVEWCSMDELLRTADVISLHTPLTPATRHLIDARALSLMKPDAVLINTARGGLVDEAALLAALQAGKLGGAGLDVFAAEPLPADHPLTRLDQVVLTPHTAGTDERAAADMAYAAAESVVQLAAGTWPEGCVVNPDVRPKWSASASRTSGATD